MTISELLADKTFKAKAKAETLSQWLLAASIKPAELISVAASAKDPAKATCIEALAFATITHPNLLDKKAFDFVTQQLASPAPRVKWESARVIAQTAHLFTKYLDEAIKNLLVNTEDKGTVVRWSAATALAEILKLNLSLNQELLPAIEAICSRETQNSIRKIYLAAMKKAKTQ